MSSSDASSPRRVLVLLVSTRADGNAELMARAAVAALPPDVEVRWLRLAGLALPPFVDVRHKGSGQYPAPTGDLARVLDDTLWATDLLVAAPLYWYSLPAPLKLYLDHWSGFMRVPGLDFKPRMAGKPLWLVTTSGDRPKAQPAIDSVRLCAEFMAMRWAGVLWGKGGAPGAIEQDAEALAAARGFLQPPRAA